jgi:hypothetical protein
MNRAVMLVLMVLISMIPSGLHAGAGSWVKLASVEIDTRTGGSTTIDLRAVHGAFTALRLQASQPIVISEVDTTPVGMAAAVNQSVLTLMTDEPSGPVFSQAEAGFVDEVRVVW